MIFLKSLTRRNFIKTGLAGAILLTGGASFSPGGRRILNRINEEWSRTAQAVRLQPEPLAWSDQQVTITWLGHAGFLINFFGTRVLLDPVLGPNIGVNPFGAFTLGPKRYITSALQADQVGPVDLLVVSHAHMDHFDYPTLRQLQSSKTEVITAKNTSPLWRGMNYKSVHELHWQEVKNIDGVEVRAIEGRHWGARLPWNKEMEANSLLISKNGVNIFFGGDTGYTTKIKQQLKGIPIDVAIMGIAAYSPKSFEAKHATPEQAWQMAMEMGAKSVIPMHWGTFSISQEPMEEPIARFRKAAAGQLDKVPIWETGATWVLPRLE